MFLYEKKIVYLSLYQDEIKKASAGFAKLSREKNAYLLDIHIKSKEELRDGSYPLFLVARSREIEWGSFLIEKGKADIKKYFSVQEGFAHFDEEEFDEKDLYGILLRIDDRQWISGYWEDPQSAHTPMKQPDLFAADEGTKNIEVKSQVTRDEEMGYASEDKWEQLQKHYKTVHPFGDERVFLSIEPKDFIIMQAPYHRLVNNSFLLHGFYNYRHMILGPDKEIGDGSRSCFYLGVPGTYFEREKMVAIMFGFEGFECDGAVEVGKFGYYMRRVEL